ncbi:HNH endonuclease [Burkholderia ubonensis]|uniref:HNH endonuclease n=1 Tax=Burkholderia ubonensis TaxID=101571 RepID=UPI0012BAF376|nr:HNH endonuclease [Burkholderia ubonensis]
MTSAIEEVIASTAPSLATSRSFKERRRWHAKLNDADLDAIYRRVEQRAIETTERQEQPVAILLGGQPGSRGYRFKSGPPTRPEHDVLENHMPACAPCNIDKHAMPLEAWRAKLSRTLDVLNRNYPTYRHACRFGLLTETPAPIIFYFERVAAEARGAGASQ